MTKREAIDVDVVGLPEIAERLGVTEETTKKWRQRASVNFPPPRWMVGRRTPAWEWHLDVLPWAESTGRFPPPAPLSKQ